MEEEAYLCKIPWIEHTNDDLNCTTSGIKSDITISKLMMDEFINTFENGVENKFKRTTMSKWNEIFSNTQSFVLKCKYCNNDFLYKKSSNLLCPFCKTKLDFIGIVNILQLNANIKNQLKNSYNIQLATVSDIGSEIKRKVVNANTIISITENDLYLNGSNKILLQLKFEQNYIIINGIEKKEITVFKDGKIKENIDISNGLKASYDDWIMFSKNLDEEYQRVIKVRKYPR